MKLLTLIISLFVITCSSASAQDWAKAQLDKSPRHLEWIDIKNGTRKLKCFVAYPEKKEKATSVLVIHEIFGLTDWVRSVCDDLAANGFIAIAPDMLSGKMDAATAAKSSMDDLRKVISTLDPNQITEDLNSASDYVTKFPAANGKLAVAGFCWGGGQAFRFATDSKVPSAILVFYGQPQEDAKKIALIEAPVYGFYGENDARISATIEATKLNMAEGKKKYLPVIYPGAGHGFMRSGEDPKAKDADKVARKEAWTRTLETLNAL